MHRQEVIEESELMITERGTIYHLDMAPEQLANTVITVGDPDRVKEVSKYFDRIESRAQHREFIAHTGYIGQKRITVVSTGIGPDNIDIVLNELDALANIDFATRTVREQKRTLDIIRIGTCGILNPEVAPGSFIASSHAVGLDNLMLYYRLSGSPDEIFILNEFVRHTALGGSALQPYVAEGSIALRKHFGEHYTHGITITCPGFYGPQGRVLRAPIAYPNLVDALTTFQCGMHRVANFEMETSAIYGLGKVLGHHCLSLSLGVNNRVMKKVMDDIPGGLERLIKESLAIIEKI
ncbi:MAG: nucleoside phosphorylase [Flavipsychrobacter sp.]|nr:nucleoside phosphorylase [Flavipsychrobacter sp.]